MLGKQILAFTLAYLLVSSLLPLGIAASTQETTGEREPIDSGVFDREAFENPLFSDSAIEDSFGSLPEEAVFDSQKEPWEDDFKEGTVFYSEGESGENPFTGDSILQAEEAAEDTPIKEDVSISSNLVQVIVVDNAGEESVLFTGASIGDVILAAKDRGLEDINLRLYGDLEVTEPILLDGGLTVTIECGQDLTLRRGSLTSPMFILSGGSSLTLSGGYVNDSPHQLTLNGEGSLSDSPLFTVKGGGSLSLCDQVTIRGSNTSSLASVIFLEKDASSLSLQGVNITGNTTSLAQGAAIYVQEGFQGNLSLGGDGSVINITGNRDGSGREANLCLARAGEEGAIVSLCGGLGAGSSIGVKALNEAHNLRIIEPCLEGEYEDTLQESIHRFRYEGSERFQIESAENLEGYLREGSLPLSTPTPLPIPTPQIRLTPSAASTPTRSPYVPAVSSALDGFRVTGFESSLEFPSGANNIFQVTGASAEVKYAGSLVVGDGKWSPYFWVIDGSTSQNNLPSSDQLNSVFTTRTFNIKSMNGVYNTSATYRVNLYFRLFTWAGMGWIATDTLQYATTFFTVARITPTPISGRAPYVPMVDSRSDGCRVIGLEAALEFPYGANNTFDVTGASAETKYAGSLVVGDGKWSPFFWVMDGQTEQNNLPSSDEMNIVFTTRTFNIKSKNGIYHTSATYKIDLYFKLFLWMGDGWAATDTIQYVQTTFTVARITPTPGGLPWGNTTVTPTPAEGIAPILTDSPLPDQETVPLGKPKKPSAKNTDKGVQLSWKKVKEARNYDVYREEALDGSGNSWGEAKWLGSTSDTTFEDKEVTHLRLYRYSVMAATYWDGTVTHESQGVSKPRVHIYLKKPGKGILSQRSKKVTLTVQSQDGVTGYMVKWKSTNSSLKGGSKKFTGENVTTEMLKKGTWVFSYRSYVTLNGTRYYSAYSKNSKIKVK